VRPAATFWTLALILFSGCAQIIYERAEVAPGATIALGGGYGARQRFWASDWGGGLSPSYGPEGTVYCQFAADESWALTLRASAAWSEQPSAVDDGSFHWFLSDGEFQVGAKYHPWPDLGHAFKLALGVPGMADFNYLYDINRHWTIGCGVGFRGVNVGLGLHIPISRHFELNAGLAGNYPAAGSVGIGIGYRSKAIEYSGPSAAHNSPQFAVRKGRDDRKVVIQR